MNYNSLHYQSIQVIQYIRRKLQNLQDLEDHRIENLYCSLSKTIYIVR